MTTLAGARPAAGLDGPVAHVGPVLAAILLVLRFAINGLNRWLMVPALHRGFGPWLATPAGGYILLLQTRGRRTGLLRQAPLSYRVADGSIWVLAGFGRATQWYRNLVADSDVVVRLPGRTVRCTAAEVIDPAERRRIAPGLVRATGIPGLLIGCNPWTAPDDRILAQLEGVPLVRLDPVDGPVTAGADDPGGRAWMWRQGFLGLVAAIAFGLARGRRRGRPAVRSVRPVPQRVG